MSITTIDDHLIHYEALGRGDPLLFVHGWFGSWRYWWPSMQALSTQHRTFALDLWGFGDSGKVPANYSFEKYIELLDRFVDRLGIAQPLTIIGHALGAAVSLRYAHLHPNHVKRLVVVALPTEGRNIHEQLANSISTQSLIRLLGKSNLHPEVTTEISKTDALAVGQVSGQLTQSSFSHELEKAPCPILMVDGENDSITRPPGREFLKLMQSNSTPHYVVLAGSNHFPMLEHPAVFNRLLQDFIQDDSRPDIRPKEYWQRRTR